MTTALTTIQSAPAVEITLTQKFLERLATEKGLLVEQLPFELYKSIDFISAHGLMDLMRSPAHFLQKRSQPVKPTPAKILGNKIHAAMLEPIRFLDEAVAMPDFGDLRTKANKEAKLEWEAKYNVPGKIPLKQEEYEQIKGMIRVMREHKLARRLMGNGRAEVSLFTKDDVTGEPMRSRFDRLASDSIIVDYKTTENADPRSFFFDAYSYNYHVQEGVYVDVAEKVLGCKNPDFYFVVQEKSPPYAITVHVGSERFRRKGRERYRRLLDLYHQCKSTNQWPSYPEKIYDLDLPARADWED